ncbi:MAG: hypothetical protein ACRC1M_06650 [Methanobacteriaceae archaeon]
MITKLQSVINDIAKELIIYNNITVDNLNELDYQLKQVATNELSKSEQEVVELAKLILEKNNIIS